MPTLLCVGSGLTPRYRLNTLQALAMPSGGRIQFRYTSSLIPKAIRSKLEEAKLNDAKVLLGYVDCTETARQPSNRCHIIPYRFANLVSSRKVGSMFILQLELADFALSSDLKSFQSKLGDGMPEWDSDGELRGAWCSEQPTNVEGVTPTSSLEHWQVIVSQIREREDFSREAYFCTIEGLYERRSDERVALSNGEYVLAANTDYELRIFHYDPDSNPHTGSKPTHWLRLNVVGSWLRLPTNSLLAIDSPYDLKTIRLISGNTVRQQHSSLVLKDEGVKEARRPVKNEQALELYLPVRIKGSMLRTVSSAVVLGTLLSAQQLLVLFTQTVKAPVITTLATIVLGLGIGFFVAFGLRKPI